MARMQSTPNGTLPRGEYLGDERIRSHSKLTAKFRKMIAEAADSYAVMNSDGFVMGRARNGSLGIMLFMGAEAAAIYVREEGIRGARIVRFAAEAIPDESIDIDAMTLAVPLSQKLPTWNPLRLTLDEPSPNGAHPESSSGDWSNGARQSASDPPRKRGRRSRKQTQNGSHPTSPQSDSSDGAEQRANDRPRKRRKRRQKRTPIPVLDLKDRILDAVTTGLPKPDTIAELSRQFTDWAAIAYDSTQKYRHSRIADLLTELAGDLPPDMMGARLLKAIQAALVDYESHRGPLSRQYINTIVKGIRFMYKWASERELVNPEIYHGLLVVQPLRRGRTAAPERPKVRAVEWETVERTLPYLWRGVQAMVRLQWLTGMRSGELTIMRNRDITTDDGGFTWYEPASHKTAHHGHIRRVPLGPKALDLIASFRSDDPDAYLFSPRERMDEFRAQLHAARKVPMSCGNSPGTNRRHEPRKTPGEHYTTSSYYQAIRTAIKAANAGITEVNDRDGGDRPLIPYWHPHMIRHAAATRLKRDFGIEVARVVLGHKTLAITDHYAEVEFSTAADAMVKVG